MLARGVNHKWEACPRIGSTQAPVHPHIKLSKEWTRIIWAWWNLTWQQFPCVLGSALLYIRVCPGLSFATKRIGPPWFTLVTLVTCYPLRIISSSNYLLPIISVLADNTLLKTAYHFLLLLVGFDTLTYRKDYDRSLILVGHQDAADTERTRGVSISCSWRCISGPNRMHFGFGSARWVGVFVRLTPNRHGRTK